jgi:hypothetical protein
MGTKNNPGAYDCYARAEPDEPLFILLAHDPSAALLVMAWRCIRAGDIQGAQACVRDAVKGLPRSKVLPLNSPKSQEAQACAQSMLEWQMKRHGT